MKIEPVDRYTITDQIVNQIGALIRSGELKPGTKLPNERELAEMFVTTRARIREGLRALALIGLIETRPGAGSFVSTTNNIPNQALELIFHKEQNMFAEMYEARKVFEPQLLYIALSKIQEADIQELNNNLELCEKAIQRDASAEQFLKYIDEFDRIIALATENSVLIKLADVLISIKKNANLKMYKVPGAMENSLEKRKKIVEALQDKNLNELKNSINEFFESSEEFYEDVDKFNKKA